MKRVDQGNRVTAALLSIVMSYIYLTDKSAWAAEQASKAGAPSTGLIRIQIGGEPSTLDPAQVMDQYSIGILRNVMEGLYTLDRDGELKKGLVDTHKISKDQLVHRFRLKKSAKWSDGTPVQVRDFVFGLKRVLDPKLGSPNADTLFAIRNAEEVYKGTKGVEALGVRLEGEELVIELHRPDPMLAYELALPAASPLRADLFEKSQGKWGWAMPTTGDYLISDYRPTDRIELKPHPFREPRARQPILYRILPEELTAGNLFENQGLEVVSTITVTELDRYKNQGVVRFVPATTVFYLGFNHQKPPFNSREWRLAISSVVDREGMAKLMKGLYEPTESYLPKSLAGFLTGLKTRDSAVIEKVREAKEKPKIVLAFGQSAFTKMMTEKLQYDFKQKLGLDIELQPMELKSLLGRLKSDPPQMYFLGQSAVYNDSMNQLHAFSSVPDANFSRYASADFEKALEAIRVGEPGPIRKKASEEANRILVEKDVALVPLLLRMQAFAVSPKLKNFHVSPYQVFPLREFELR